VHVALTISTVGHSSRSQEELLALLARFGVGRLVDVRTVPRSGRHPHFSKEALAGALSRVGIDYRHLPALGGLRPPSDEGHGNDGWPAGGFRNYADYALTGPFKVGLDALLSLAEEKPTAIMCAEARWQECHRRLITDYLLARGVSVRHILDLETEEPASMTPFARIAEDGSLRYPAAQPRLL
jgi:uncharacterized protein (DUF488 family)